jgi:anaerobic selenocysteine-containing dehydrogenase
MRIHRRDLFRAGAAAVAGMSVAACRGSDPYTRTKPPLPGTDTWRRFQEASVATACGQCAANCGVRVRVVEGRAVRIDGALDNPINRGGIGPRGVASLQVVYDPDRIRQPLHRRDGKLVPIDWDEALDLLSERLVGLRNAGNAERLLVLCGRERGMVRELWQRFSLAYGTPNFFDGTLREGGGLRLANELMQGVADLPAYDWGGTHLILSLGAGVLESSCQSVYLARLTSHLRRGRAGDRARIVQVEPSWSRTAAHADDWLSIVPGTYAAFALALAHVLVRDGIHDRSFVEQHTFGFEDWTDASGVSHIGFRRRLLDNYAPERIAPLCGIAPERIVGLAHQLGELGPSLAVIDPYTTQDENGLQAAMAVLSLNALLGAIQRPGGIVDQPSPPFAPWPEVSLDDAALASLERQPVVAPNPFGKLSSALVANALLEASAPPIDTALLYYANPCYAWPHPERWREALAKVPFVVSFSPFLDETVANVAHLVLPDHTFLERFEDAQPAPSIGRAVLGVFQPAVQPLYDTRATPDVLIQLARGIGGSVAEAFPWKEFRFAFAQRVMGIQKSRRGSISTDSPRTFFRDLFRDGFWADEEREWTDTEPQFATDSRKFEFASMRLRAGLERMAAGREVALDELLGSLGYPEDADEACMAHVRPEFFAAPHDGDGATLVVDAYKPGTYAEGSGANLPLLQELVTEPGAEPWTTLASVAPETAAVLGVGAGERIELSSDTGTVTITVRILSGMRPGIVRIPRGGGHTEFGRFARGRGVNPLHLIAQRADAVGGFPLLHGQRVRARKVKA